MYFKADLPTHTVKLLQNLASCLSLPGWPADKNEQIDDVVFLKKKTKKTKNPKQDRQLKKDGRGVEEETWLNASNKEGRKKQSNSSLRYIG